MSSPSTRRFIGDLSYMLDKYVMVKLVNGRSYQGTLTGLDNERLNLSLSNAKDDSGKLLPKVIINGSIIQEILLLSSSIFDPQEFAVRVEKELNLRPGDVKVYPEGGFVMILDKIKVSESGVEGSGSLAQRIYDIYSDYINKKKASIKQ
jgi:small nuclear ribonucleoprotein (snRNP)-like protein